MEDKDVPFKGEQEHDHDRRINPALAAHAAQQKKEDWEMKDIYEELFPWIQRLNIACFEGKLNPTAFSIDYDRRNTLGTYRPGLDGLALNWRVNLNACYRGAPLAFKLSVLLHELIHQWECSDPKWKKPKSRDGWKYHTAAWRAKASELGISKKDNRKGVWQPPDPNGKFVALLREHNVDPEPLWMKEILANATDSATEGKDENTSTTRPWTCSCTRVYVAAKTELKARCDKCGEAFTRQ